MNKLFRSVFAFLMVFSGISCSPSKPTPDYSINLNIPKNYFYLSEKSLSVTIYVFLPNYMPLFKNPGTYEISEIINKKEIVISSGEIDYSNLKLEEEFNFDLNLEKNDLLNESGVLIVYVRSGNVDQDGNYEKRLTKRIKYDVKYDLVSFSSI